MNENFDGVYEIMGEDGPCGTLEVTQRGLYTLFCAKCSSLSGVRRVAVSDYEREYVLGVLMPTPEGCEARRLLSSAQLKQTGLVGVKCAYIAGLKSCPIEDSDLAPEEAPQGLPLNIGGEFACPESFVTLTVEDREDGLYGFVPEDE